MAKKTTSSTPATKPSVKASASAKPPPKHAAAAKTEEVAPVPPTKAKVALIYKQTGNLRAVQILLGHTKLESTVRYLGVDAEDALTPSEGTKV